MEPDTAFNHGHSNSDAESAQPTPMRWTICAMLFVATSINYMDRQVIAILKPTLQQSIGLTELQYGYIVDAFQISYAAGLLGVGRLIDKLGTRIGYMLVMAVWSLSAMGHALATSAMEFGVARFSLGLGESGNFPAAIKTVAEWFPQKERSLATGLFNSGANIGAILAPAFVPWVTLRYGWHAAFLITGLLGGPWIVWWFLRYHPPASHALGGEDRSESTPTFSWLRLLSFRQTWGFSLAKFLTDPIWWFYLYWLPSYFSSKFNLSLSHLGLPLIIIYNVSAIGSIGGGWLPSPFRKMGLKPNHARLAAMLFCGMAVVPTYTAAGLKTEWAAIAVLSLAAGAHQGFSANLFTTVSDMFPRSAVGSVVGIGGMAGALGGAVFAFLAGHVLELTHSYRILFATAACAYLLALIILCLFAPALKKVELAE